MLEMSIQIQVLRLENRLADLFGDEGRERHLPTGHVIGDLLPVKVLLRAVDHIFSVPQDAQAFRHLQHLIQLVADKDQGDPLCLQPGDDVVQRVHLLGGQGGGGLVHDDELRVQQQRPADGHHLLFSHGELAHLGIQVQVNADLIDHLLGQLPVPLLVHRLVPVIEVVLHGNVLCDGEVGEQ